jgi:hypothetical protein
MRPPRQYSPVVTTGPKTESELQRNEYLATREELQIIDAATASIDAGEARFRC